ncbi:MAG TPA: TRAP transporter substrate-binding protein [Microvirga sp.]|jgi:TRAP-type mannitol/chloroaromatic compound transport system substrate-binding protein|nr:TRAP transporter substrate-binding protein [Microvirga sp.]
MKRRTFLAAATAGAAATAIAAPAIAQSNPDIRWRLSSGFPKSLDTLFGANEEFARHVSEATDGKFQIQPFAAGEIVGTFQAFDAVSNGTVEMIQAPGYYYVGKDPAFAVFADIPFGLNARQKAAWLNHGGGNELVNEFLGKFNVHGIAAGNTGTQMGGWFRKEIKSVADVQGLKFRIAGIAGQVFQKLGAVPQQIAGGDIYPALERGTIDAAEWVGPYDDEKLGFQKVAPFYYYPGFWEGGPTVHYMFHKPKWDELPKAYKTIVEDASARVNMNMLAKYDARNPAALRRLVGTGAQLRPFPQDMMEAAFKASNELYDEISATNPAWKKMYDSLRAFRNEEYLWFQVAEYTFDNFMIRSRGRG